VTTSDTKSISDELVVVRPDTVINHAKDQTLTYLKTARQTEDWRVRLTRYAAQQLYAPERLLHGDNQIKRIPIDTQQPVPLVRGQRIEAQPVVAWQGGGFTVTAIKLRNITEQRLHLVLANSTKPNTIDLAYALRGHWLTAVTQHDFLGAEGKETDTTTLYLVSDRPFIESLGVAPQPNGDVKEATDG
jgi:integrating conjugative element protein (TIGR03749 family)